MKNKLVLIIDDTDINRDILTDILEDEYQIVTACDGEEGLKVLYQHYNSINVILLDLNMPKLDGYQFLEHCIKNKIIGKKPILIISADGTLANEKRCFDLGASDFVRRPFDSYIVKRRVNNVVEQFTYKNRLEEKVLDQTNEITMQNRALRQQAEILKKNNDNIINILGNIVESRDLESGEHILRVREYTKIIAEQMMKDYPEYDLDEHKVDVIAAASALHDIGKIEIPDSVLLKPGKLTDDEFSLMKLHTLKGCKILEKIEDAWNDEYGKYSYDICRYHHERYDGKGYPDGLKADEIPIAAQCVSIADVYDALTNTRCYKAAYSEEKTYEMIMSGQCGVFSPKLLDAFEKSRLKFKSLLPKERVLEVNAG